MYAAHENVDFDCTYMYRHRVRTVLFELGFLVWDGTGGGGEIHTGCDDVHIFE